MSCYECPYNPVIQVIRNGGEEICPDAFTDVSQYCGFNQENKEEPDIKNGFSQEKKGEQMRDCENCVYAKPFGGENDNRCSAWSCEFIDRNEAIEAWEFVKYMKESEAKVIGEGYGGNKKDYPQNQNKKDM